MGASEPNCWTFSCDWPPLGCSGVHTGPGATAFTRRLCRDKVVKAKNSYMPRIPYEISE